MTEEEARAMWCPMVQVAGVGANWINNRGALDSRMYNTNCIASDCMMWRTMMNYDGDEIIGYCGLGGK